MSAITGRDLATQALQEINALAPEEQLSDRNANYVLAKLNRMLNEWGALKRNIYAMDFSTYALIPNTQPHTIGPAPESPIPPPNFVVDQRPVRIESAQIVLAGSNPSTNLPLNIRDAAWWANLRVPGVATSIPTDLYYQANYPNGEVFLWPVPNFANQIQLETWQLLGELADLNAELTMPPGYWNAIVTNLAIRCCAPFEKAPAPTLVDEARRSLAAIQSNNAKSPRAMTLDAGMPDKGRPKGGEMGGWNWLTGGPA